MKRLILAAAAGLAATSLPAAAQERVDYTLSFIEVLAGTNTPLSNPNGIVEPGEAARISITAQVTPPVGSPVTYSPPPAPGTGVIAGLGSMFVDLAVGNQSNPSPSGAGSWSSIERASGWALGGAGEPTSGGARVMYITAGQFVSPGTTVNPANPILDIWQGVWTPLVYSDRAVTWRLFSTLSGIGAASILIQYGQDPSGNPLYTGEYVPATYGSTTIPIIPAPASLFALSAILLQRRRRGS